MPRRKYRALYSGHRISKRNGGRISLKNGGDEIEWLNKIYNFFGLNDKQTEKPIYYRNQLGTRVNHNDKILIIPRRKNVNTSRTQKESQGLENSMAFHFALGGDYEPFSYKQYDIPFVKDKEHLLDGHTTSLNVVDSLAKYTALHNKNPQVTRTRTNLAKTRPVDIRETIGLLHESSGGAIPFYNYGTNSKYNRALGNANYFTAFGFIPSEALLRDWTYKIENNRNLPPILHSIRRYAQGDYNRGMGKGVHTRNTKQYANKYLEDKVLSEYLYNLKNIYPDAFLKKYKYGGRISLKHGGIHINPVNRGKFTETMRRTGKTAEELSHSKNLLTRKRAIFALNARKWKH